MLKSWFIQNFKPILDSGDLPLAPVTVLAGRNSSGKSSLIQSILMIAQTLSNRIGTQSAPAYGCRRWCQPDFTYSGDGIAGSQ